MKSNEDFSTEEKIKNAARSVFHKKGYAAARTRDIAEEAGLNLALINYYFRSKAKLFDIVMMESLQGFVQTMSGVFNDEETSLERKIEIFVGTYIDLLIGQPDIPLFVLSELRENPAKLMSAINMKDFIMKSYFIKQFQQGIINGSIPPLHPLQFMMNLAGLVVFPFIGSPMVKSLGDMSQEDFNELMQQRKYLIPKWIGAMLKVR